MSGEEYSILKVTQETTAQEAIQQALRKSGHSTERGEDYLLVEDVHKSWDKKDAEKGGTQRVLELNERVMQAQNKWRGSGRFLLRKKTGDPRTLVSSTSKDQKRYGSSASELGSLDWEAQQQTFLVCVHNVAPDLPYSILRAPVSSTSQDIITQAMMKARRPEDPRQFVLTEELHLFNFEPKNRHCAPRVERRVLPSDENMFQAQSLWRSSAGKFILTERAQAQIEAERRKKESRSPLQRINMRLTSMARERKMKSRSAEASRDYSRLSSSPAPVARTISNQCDNFSERPAETEPTPIPRGRVTLQPTNK